jgi:hypothetical protein
MNWLQTGIFSLVGGVVIGCVIDVVLLATGACGIDAVAKGMIVGVPIGSVVGIVVYRKVVLNSLTAADVAGGCLALIISALATVAGLHAMDVMGGVPGLAVAFPGSCLGSLLGYAMSLRIVERHEIRGDKSQGP